MTDKPSNKSTNPKIPTNTYKELSMGEVSKLKDTLVSLNPKALIDSALSSSSKTLMDSKSTSKKDDLLEQTKINAVSNFITDLRNKNEKQMHNTFLTKVEEYNRGTQVIIDKSKKEVNQYISHYNAVKDENKHLTQQITDLNNEYRKLENHLKESELAISKLQSRFEVFNKNKELFEEFNREFPNKYPIDIMKEIVQRNTEAKLLLEQYNKAKYTIEELQKEKIINESNSRKAFDELNQKIIDIELSNKNQNEKYQQEILSLQLRLNNLSGYKDENILLHKMLFRIYNLLFEEFRLDKNITINKSLDCVDEKDFKPDLFNNEEIMRYIEIMIADMHEQTSGRLLRDTIAFANMIVRIYLKDKVNLRYDPVNTFKMLKGLIDSKEEKILKLSEQNKDLQIKINQLQIEKKHIISELNYLHSQMNNIKNKNLHKLLPKTNINTNNNTIIQDHKTKRALLKSASQPHLNINIDKRIIQTQENKSGAISSSRFVTTNKEMHNLREIEKFKDIKMSKNRDKLIKTPGYQNLVSNLKGFNELVEHTNKLFLYRSKMGAKHYKHLSSDKFKSVNKKYRPLTASKSAVYEDKMNVDIINRLNGLINIIEKNDRE